MAHHSILVMIGVYCSVLNILVVTKDSLFATATSSQLTPMAKSLIDDHRIVKWSRIVTLFQVKWDRREGNSGGQDWWWHHISSPFFKFMQYEQGEYRSSYFIRFFKLRSRRWDCYYLYHYHSISSMRSHNNNNTTTHNNDQRTNDWRSGGASAWPVHGQLGLETTAEIRTYTLQEKPLQYAFVW